MAENEPTQTAPEAQDAAPGIEPVFVARQPVFDRDRNIWGYELLFRHSAEATRAEIPEERLATAKVVADGLVLALAGMKRKRKFLINFPEDLLKSGAAHALSTERCVVEILETVPSSPETLTAIRELKTAGFTIALDDFFGQPELAPFLELADIVKVDVLGRSPDEITAMARGLANPCRTLLAEKIESAQIFDHTLAQGFGLFQGFHFSRPEVLKGQKISAGASSRIQLLRELGREDFEINKLSDIISRDPSISYRLLQYLNSAFFSFPTKIQTIRQAISMLGSRPLKQWLMVVLISDLSRTPQAGEVCFSSVQRARFLENMGKQQPTAWSSETLFMLGLFSRLDALLGLDMKDIVTGMPLDMEISQALLGKRNRASVWLEMLSALERGDWEIVRLKLDELAVAPESAARTWAEAATWAMETVGNEAK